MHDGHAAMHSQAGTDQQRTDPLMDLLECWPMSRVWVDPEAATANAESVLAIAVRNKNDVAAAHAHLVIGSGLAVQGRMALAEQHISSAEALFINLNDKLGLVKSTSRMNLIWLERENHEAAIPALSTALEIAREIRDSVQESSILNDLGLQYDLAGEPELAATHLFQALEIADETDESWQATIRYNIGHVLSNQPDHETAIEWLEEALIIADRIRDPSTAVFAHESLAVSYEALGVPDMALIHLFEGMDKARTCNHHRSFAAFSLDSGRLLALNDPATAIGLLRTAAEAYRALDDPLLAGRAWIAEFRISLLLGTFNESLYAGLVLATSRLEDAHPADTTLFEYYDALERTAAQIGRLDDALIHARSGSESKERYWRRLAEMRGIQSSRKHQLDHARAVAKREREQRIALTQAMIDLKEANAVNEALVLQLQEQARLLERQATEDSLTGIGNRRYFDSHLERESIRASSFGRPISVALADVDLFKTVNDRYTHQVGDVVLKMIAEIMRSESREIDIVARYGGEEFAFLFTETSLSESAEQAERIRSAVETFAWDKIAQGLRVTLSIGVVCSEDGGTPERLVANADSLLYLAKHRGRNQVRSSSLSTANDVFGMGPRAHTIFPFTDRHGQAIGTDIFRQVS